MTSSFDFREHQFHAAKIFQKQWSQLPGRRLHERKLVRVVDVVVLKLYAATSASQRH